MPRKHDLEQSLLWRTGLWSVWGKMPVIPSSVTLCDPDSYRMLSMSPRWALAAQRGTMLPMISTVSHLPGHLYCYWSYQKHSEKLQGASRSNLLIFRVSDSSRENWWNSPYKSRYLMISRYCILWHSTQVAITSDNWNNSVEPLHQYIRSGMRITIGTHGTRSVTQNVQS